MESLIERAKAANCSALILTLDLQILGQCHKDLKNKLSAPPGLKPLHLWQMMQRPGWCLNMLTTKRHAFRNIVGHAKGVKNTASLFEWTAEQFDPRLSWDDVEWIENSGVGR